jgi:hypothetical protein
MRQVRLGGWILLGLGLFLGAGCGAQDEGPKTYPVSGTVTLKGQPAEGVTVSFIPDSGGQSAVGVTDASGKYQLTTRKKDDGAVPGRYKVTLAKYEGKNTPVTDASEMHADYDISNEYPPDFDPYAAEAPPSKNLFPTKYANPSTSGLTAEVVEGDNPPKDFALDG